MQESKRFCYQCKVVEIPMESPTAFCSETCHNEYSSRVEVVEKQERKYNSIDAIKQRCKELSKTAEKKITLEEIFNGEVF
jgi:hypothetical protein